MDRVVNYLEHNYHCSIVGTSVYLSNRSKLKEDLKKLTQADVLLTELKAAAVDVATKTALQMGKSTIYCDNELQVVEYTDGDIDSIQSLNSYLIEITKKIVDGRATIPT
jgi:cyclic 2,3-diphosphoglycerate synthetase